MVTVTLKNEVSVDKIEFAGDYLISETVNGYPSWKSGENEIWCSRASYQGNWLIGKKNDLGEYYGEFYASNDYEGLHSHLYLVTDNRLIWKYTSPGKGWITDCTSFSQRFVFAASIFMFFRNQSEYAFLQHLM